MHVSDAGCRHARESWWETNAPVGGMCSSENVHKMRLTCDTGPRTGDFNLGYAYPWGYVGSFQGVREHHCRICIILLEKVGVDCMWSAEPIGDVHFTAS